MDSDDLDNQVRAKIASGDAYLDSDDFERAAQMYREAIRLIPEPQHLYWVALPAFTALGEAYFYAGDYAQALQSFRSALKAPNGLENPLVYLRLGQTLFEIGDLHHAAEALIRAYALEGKEIFADEDDKYFLFLSQYLNP